MHMDMQTYVGSEWLWSWGMKTLSYVAYKQPFERTLSDQEAHFHISLDATYFVSI